MALIKRVAGLTTGLIAIATTMGILMTVMALPLIIPATSSVRLGDAYWNALRTDLADPTLPTHSTMRDSEGNEIARFYSQNRVLVDIDDISPYVVEALVATEDERFYEHHGVDLRGVTRAAANNIVGGGRQGASTITQQLVKNTLILNATNDTEVAAAQEVSADRKIQEIRYALALEETHTKEEIVEDYLNVVFYANGVYGIGTAAKYYFNKNAADLTVAEAALLVGIVNSPSTYDPINNPEGAKQRRNLVIDRMMSSESITAEDGEAAKAEEIALDVTRSPNGCGVSDYPFYCQYVLDSLRTDSRLGDTQEERESRLYHGGLTINTPLDTRLMGEVQEVVDRNLGRDNRVAAGVAVVEPGTGHVKALVQNRTWGDEGNTEGGDNHTQIVYPNVENVQTGSVFKVVTLAAALESGFPANGIIDTPKIYNPSNMNVPPGGIKNDGVTDTSGPLDLVTGTVRSSNTFFATLQERTGVLTVADMSENLGIPAPEGIGPRDASYTLGTAETSPLAVSAMYATFAADGLYCAPVAATSIQLRSSDEPLGVPEGNCHQAVSATTATTVTNALVANIDGDHEWRTGRLASIGRPAGGKTGSTEGFAASWFAGITPQYATALWLGDPRGGFSYPLSDGFSYKGRWTTDAYGSRFAAPFWSDIMESAMAGQPVEQFSGARGGDVLAPRAVPSVVGLAPAEAVSALQTQGYKVAFSESQAEASEGVPSDVVVAQTPGAGKTSFAPGEVTVELTLSNGSAPPPTSEDE